MRTPRPLIFALLMIGTALAGCVTAEDAPAAPASAPEVVVDDSMGSLTGNVVDDTLSPVANAQVAAIGTSVETATTTALDGSFTINGLSPGTYTVHVQKLGYAADGRRVDIVSGSVAEVSFVLEAQQIGQEMRYELLLGNSYFACGAYLVVTSWGNLHACVFDDQHKPYYLFHLAQDSGVMGVMQEVAWDQTSALSAPELQVFFSYQTVCDPFCSYGAQWNPPPGSSASPIRKYYDDFEDDLEDFSENPVPIESRTFPGGSGSPNVVFQQHMDHYITVFYNGHGDLDEYSALPDA